MGRNILSIQPQGYNKNAARQKHLKKAFNRKLASLTTFLDLAPGIWLLTFAGLLASPGSFPRHAPPSTQVNFLKSKYLPKSTVHARHPRSNTRFYQSCSMSRHQWCPASMHYAAIKFLHQCCSPQHLLTPHAPNQGETQLIQAAH